MKAELNTESVLLVESTVKSVECFSGKLVHLFLDEVQLPDGSHSTREWIRHPGAAAVVPVFEDGSVMLVKQYRYPVRQIFYEVPAGKIDPGEPPEKTAERETREETGLRAGKFAYVGHFYPVIGYSDEIIHIYAAWDLEQAAKNRDRDEFLLNVRIPFRKALEMIDSGEISDGKTICSLLRTWRWWERDAPFPIPH